MAPSMAVRAEPGSPSAKIAAVILCAALCLAAPAIARAQAAAPPTGASGGDAQALVRLATQRFGTLSTAEMRLAESAPMRMLRWLGPANGSSNPANDSTHGDKWGPERTVRAEFVEWLAADPDAARLVHPSGLGIAGASIEGELDLSYRSVDKPITIVSCYVPGGIDLSSANLAGFTARRSNIGSISGNETNINGDLAIQ
ncbi:MAG TPA: hypothetical protein VMT58_06245, partial [Candidatus Binataceae bacterium]|nr:hypothetical protein [Candidatus Binataceae bacterium]